MMFTKEILIRNLEMFALAPMHQCFDVNHDGSLKFSQTENPRAQQILNQTVAQAIQLEITSQERVWVEIKDGKHECKVYSIGRILYEKNISLPPGIPLELAELSFADVEITRSSYGVYKGKINPEKSQYIKNQTRFSKKIVIPVSDNEMSNVQLEYAFTFFKTGSWSPDLSYKDYLAVWKFGKFLQAADLIKKAEEGLSQLPFTQDALEHLEHLNSADTLNAGISWASKRPPHELLSALRACNRPTVMGAELLNKRIISEKSFQGLEDFQACINLEYITYLNASTWKEIGNEQFGALLKQCLVLRDLKLPKHVSGDVLKYLKHVQKLQSLDISECKQLAPNSLDHLQHVPNLLTLNISFCLKLQSNSLTYLQHVKKLESLDIGWCARLEKDCLKHLQHVQNLRSLEIGWCCRLEKDCLKHLKHVQRLTKLDISSCIQLEEDCLKYLKHVQDLRMLDISSCHQLSRYSLEHLEYVQNLDTLEIMNCTQLDDECLSNLQYVQNLQNLGIMHCTQLAPDSLIYLESVPNLKRLNLGWCTQLKLDSFSCLKDTPNLDRLDVEGCDHSIEEIRHYLQYTPNLKTYIHKKENLLKLQLF